MKDTAETSNAVRGATERRERLVDFVGSRGFCTITELAHALGVSEMTVRRDVRFLLEQRRIRAFHGGVSALGGREFLGTDYALRIDEHRALKDVLSIRAVEIAQGRSVIAIDSGTTGVAVAAAIPKSWELRVVTNSLPVITALNTQQGVEVTALGGVLHLESQSFFGVRTTSAVANFHVETFFLTASAISERGIYCTYEFGAATKRAFMDVASQVVLVADSSKFTAGAMTRVCGWDSINIVVTDDGVSEEMRDVISEAGVELVIADTHGVGAHASDMAVG